MVDFEVQKIVYKKDRQSQFFDQIEKVFSKEQTMQEALGLKDKTMHRFHDIACDFYEEKNFVCSADAFLALTTLNPYVHAYWLGLGMAEQELEKPEAALNAYSLAVLTDADNPMPHVYAAECYFALQDLESAKRSLNLAMDCAQSLTGQRALVDKIQYFTDELEKSCSKLGV